MPLTIEDEGAGEPAGGAPPEGGGAGDGGDFDLSMLADKPPAELLSDDDLRTHPSLASYKNIEGLARSHINLEKMLGQKDRLLTLPGEDASPEQVAEFYGKLGRPDEPGGYQLNDPDDLPEGAGEVNKDLVDGFRAKAHEAGLSTQQANELYSWFRQTEAGAMTQVTESREESLRSAQESLQQEWGSAYEQRLAAAQEAARSYGDDFVNWLNETGMGNDPRLARVLADVAEAKLEDSPRTGGAPGSGPMTPDQATSEIRRLQGDESFQKVYYDQHHPNHEDAVRKMSRLFQQAHPEPRRG